MPSKRSQFSRVAMCRNKLEQGAQVWNKLYSSEHSVESESKQWKAFVN